MADRIFIEDVVLAHRIVTTRHDDTARVFIRSGSFVRLHHLAQDEIVSRCLHDFLLVRLDDQSLAVVHTRVLVHSL